MSNPVTPPSSRPALSLSVPTLGDGMTQALTEVLRLEAIPHLEERWEGMEKWVNERMRVVEMQLMHMERQFWKRSHSMVFRGPPSTPLSSVETSSVSSRSSIAPYSDTPSIESLGPFDGSDAPSTPDSLSTSCLYSIVEDKESLLPEPPVPQDAETHMASTDLSRIWAPPPSPPAALPDQVNIEAKLRALIGSDGPELSAELQRFLKHGSPALRSSLLEHMQTLLIPLAQDRFGHFLVMRALRLAPSLGTHLRGFSSTMIRHPYGAQVVLCMLGQETGLHDQVLTDLLACHLREVLLLPEALPIWRKVFSTPWDDPCLLRRLRDAVNDALQGQWVATANSEDGSALCQSLVEHHWLRDHDSGVQELLEHFLDIACHQWGVWVIQHMLEHGTPIMRAAIAHLLLQTASIVSLSSYGSKAIQSALHWCGAPFQQPYAERLCQLSGPVRASRTSGTVPRPLLIDLAAAQHGLPIITEVCACPLTQLLTTAHPMRRRLMIRLVERHAPFLQCNRSGARVCLLCDRARAMARS